MEERYERYRAWCRGLDLAPADFVTWAKEIAKISEISGIRGYGNNLVQKT